MRKNVSVVGELMMYKEPSAKLHSTMDAALCTGEIHAMLSKTERGFKADSARLQAAQLHDLKLQEKLRRTVKQLHVGPKHRLRMTVNALTSWGKPRPEHGLLALLNAQKAPLN
jgi:hypothetical protein